MDLPCFEWQRHVEKKWDTLSPAAKASFSSLLEEHGMLAFVQTVTGGDDVTILQDVSKGYQVRKSPEYASALREQGNMSFKAQDYSTASLLYSQGVCHASPGSEELALCYANRSAALLHLRRHLECLDDVGRALAHGYPSHLQPKLMRRRQQCLQHLQQTALGKAQGVSERDGAASQPHVHPAAALCFSPEKGRHLVATDSIAAGEVVLEERAFACVLIPGTGRGSECEPKEGLFGTEDQHCHLCLLNTVNPVPCAGCSFARYCSEACQQHAWDRHHCRECAVGGELRATGVLAHLAFRVALRAGWEELQRARLGSRGSANGWHTTETAHRQDESASKAGAQHGPRKHSSKDMSEQHLDGSYLCVYQLLPHVGGHVHTLRFLWAVTVTTLCKRLQQAGALAGLWSGGACKNNAHSDQNDGGWPADLSMLGSVVLRHVLQLRCNAQAVTVLRDSGSAQSSVCSVEEVRVATAVFPTLSMLNHSCCPNTSTAFRAGTPAALRAPPGDSPHHVTVVVRAAQTVGAEQELLHCYGPHQSRLPASERQRLLQDQYYFMCQCDACLRELGSESSGQGVHVASGLSCVRCGSALQLGTSGFLCPRPGCRFELSHMELKQRLQELRSLMERAVHLMERERPDKAAQLLHGAIEEASAFLAETHPVQGELADTAARAHAAMGDWHSAATQLSRSLSAVQAQYGDGSAELGRQLFKLVQLHFNGGEPHEALAFMPEARRLISLHFDSLCEELQELTAMEDCLQGAL